MRLAAALSVAMALVFASGSGKRLSAVARAGGTEQRVVLPVGVGAKMDGTAGGTGKGGTAALVWLRNDLRLRDNPLFHHRSTKTAQKVVPVFCFDPRHFGSFGELNPRWSQGAVGFNKTGLLRARFLVESVAALRASLRRIGSDLFVAHGRPEEVLPALASDLLASGSVERVHVLAQSEAAHEEAAVESAVASALPGKASLETMWGAQTLYSPEDLPFELKKLPEPFTAFRNVVESEKKPVRVLPELPEPDSLPPPAVLSGTAQVDVASTDDVLRRLGFSSDEVKQAIDPRCANTYEGGEASGMERLEKFVKAGLATYKQTRDGFLGSDFSSKMSPWMAVGCVSPRTVYWRVARYEVQHGETLDTYWLTFELKWRDFFRFFSVKHGRSIFFITGPAKKSMTWSTKADVFERWRLGETGVPFVDANMRELRLTGFMSNRGRQCVASFLTQDLKLDWRLGAQWFEHTLLDHDVASNYGNWAFAAGVGMRGHRLGA